MSIAGNRIKTSRTRLMAVGLALAVLVTGALSTGASGSALSPVGIAGEGVFIGDLNGNRLSDDLDAHLTTSLAEDPVPVIVVLKERPAADVATQLGFAPGAFVARDHWEAALRGFSADLTPAQITSLARNPLVTRVDYDREVRAFLGTATQWSGVQQARSSFGVTGDRDGNPTTYSSTDVVICVLDTGINVGHVDLDGGKVIGWADFINGWPVPYDDNFHGTHCASIAAGTGEGDPAYTGVAPGAALVGVKVLNAGGVGSTSTIINGINWMINNKNTYGIRIGSMSLGSAGSSDGTDSLSVAVNNAVSNGIIMCVAAGNAGPARSTIGSPAAATGAITVGAVVDPGEKGWALAWFSSRGPTADQRTKPDICAPGYKITAAAAGTQSSYRTESGTSMATPFVAGVIALMLDAQYGLDVSGAKNILYSAANVKDIGPSGPDIDGGYGLTLAFNAVRQAGNYSGTWSDGLNWSYHTNNPFPPATDSYYFTVTDASKPIAVTMVIPFYNSYHDMAMWLYNPSGVLVAEGQIPQRQNTILYQPVVTGQYRLDVDSCGLRGRYWINISWK